MKIDVTPDCEDSYFFTSVFSIWGWASWRRVVDKWEGDYAFLRDKQAMRQLNRWFASVGSVRTSSRCARDHAHSGKEFYESIFWASMLLNSSLAIIPCRNLINNLGLSDDSTHFSGRTKTTPKAYRRIFTMKRHELEFPLLKHPKYVVENVDFKERVYRINAWGHPFIKMSRSLEELFLNLRYGNFSSIFKAMAPQMSKDDWKR